MRRPTSGTVTPLRLCVLGWFGHQNAGDDRIAQVLVRRMEGCHLTFLPFMPLPSEVVDYFDGLVLTAGVWHARNLLARDFHRWSKRVHVPIAAVGLGVEDVTPGMEEASAALVERSVFLWVRDNESKRQLGDHSTIVVGPDVTWALPLEPTADGGHESGTIALNLRHWQRAPWQPEAWVEAARALAPAGLRPWSLGPADWIQLEPFFPGCPKWFEARTGRRAEVAVGMRLHSLIFAAQMAVPPIALRYDPKCRRFLEGLDRPAWALDLGDHTRLEATIEAVRAQRGDERRHLLEQRERYEREAGQLLTKATQALHQAAGGRRGRALSSRALIWLGRRFLTAGYARQAPPRSSA